MGDIFAISLTTGLYLYNIVWYNIGGRPLIASYCGRSDQQWSMTSPKKTGVGQICIGQLGLIARRRPRNKISDISLNSAWTHYFDRGLSLQASLPTNETLPRGRDISHYDSVWFILRQHDDSLSCPMTIDGRSQIKIYTDKRTQVHSARSSLTVTHKSTNRNRRCLTSVSVPLS